MKRLLSLLASVVIGTASAFSAVSEDFPAAFQPSDGTTVNKFSVSAPPGSGPWPAVVVFHSGSFKSGSESTGGTMVTAINEMANHGYIVFSASYRLAPPGLVTGQPAHTDPASGRPPQQIDDIESAVLAVEADPRVIPGKVAVLGGQAGATHALYAALDTTTHVLGTVGAQTWTSASRPAAAVALSPYAQFDERAAETYTPDPVPGFISDIVNYTNSTDLPTQHSFDPVSKVTSTAVPIYFFSASADPMPYHQFGDLKAALDGAGVTNYFSQELTGGTQGGFGYWTNALVHTPVLAFLDSVFAVSGPTPTPTPPPPSVELYHTTSSGVALYWTAYAQAGPAPAVLVLHAGGYKAGGAGPQAIAEDLQTQGFFALAVEYRLAPPASPMRTDGVPPHPAPGQDTVGDTGHYPEQTDDVLEAVHLARIDPRCDGRVYVVGGSAGASHSLYVLGAGVPGDSQPDLAILNSCGISNTADLQAFDLVCSGTETCPHEAVMNYVGYPDPWPTHPTGAALDAMTAAAPIEHSYFGMPPVFIVLGGKDSIGIPTSTGIAAYAYDKDGNQGAFEPLSLNGAIPRLQALGIVESTAAVPEANTYKQMVVNGSVTHEHAFAYWTTPINGTSGPTVRDVEVAWLRAGPPSSSPTPTPTPTATPTPPPKPQPAGIYILLPGNCAGCPSIVEGDLWLDNPAIDGARMRLGWNDIQPHGPDTFEGWTTRVDPALAVAAAHGKKVGLSIAAGVTTPNWVYTSAPPVYKYELDPADAGHYGFMPLSWDTNFQTKWQAFVTAFAERYDNDPRLSYVIFTGLQAGDEMYIARTARDGECLSLIATKDAFTSQCETEPDYTGFTGLADYADLSAAYRFGTEAVIDMFEAAFTHTVMMLSTATPYPGGGTDGAHVAALIDDDPSNLVGTMTTQLHATPAPSPTVTPVPCNLKPEGDQAIQVSTNPAFYASPAPSPYPVPPDLVRDILDNAVAAGDKFFELYKNDVNLAANADIEAIERLRFYANDCSAPTPAPPPTPVPSYLKLSYAGGPDAHVPTPFPSPSPSPAGGVIAGSSGTRVAASDSVLWEGGIVDGTPRHDIDGIGVTDPWYLFEPTKNHFDTTFMDSEIARAAAAGKKVTVRILTMGGVYHPPGDVAGSMPPWLFSDVIFHNDGTPDNDHTIPPWSHAGDVYTYLDGPNGGAGNTRTIPVFWNPDYLNRKKILYAMLGEHLTHGTNINTDTPSTLSQAEQDSATMVGVSYANAESEDFYVPAANNTPVPPYTLSQYQYWINTPPAGAGWTLQKMKDAAFVTRDEVYSDGVTASDNTLISATATFTQADIGKVVSGVSFADDTRIATWEVSLPPDAPCTKVTLTKNTLVTGSARRFIIINRDSGLINVAAAAFGKARLTTAVGPLPLTLVTQKHDLTTYVDDAARAAYGDAKFGLQINSVSAAMQRWPVGTANSNWELGDYHFTRGGYVMGSVLSKVYGDPGYRMNGGDNCDKSPGAVCPGPPPCVGACAVTSDQILGQAGDVGSGFGMSRLEITPTDALNLPDSVTYLHSIFPSP